MKKISAIVSAFVALGLVFVNTLLVSSFAYADGKPDYKFAITPTQQAFESVEPGKTYSGQFAVKNEGSKEFEFNVDFSRYSVESETYSVDYEKETQYTDIVNWLSVDIEHGKVGPGQSVELTYSFTVPEDAHGGMQAGAVMVSMGGNDDGNVQAVRRLGYIVYANVDGETVRTAKVLENKIPSFLFKPPIVGTSVVENTGNVYTVAQYSLQVFPLFSDEEIYTNEETPEGNVVFPETKKMNTIGWEGAPQLGVFRVRQTVKIFDEESVTEKIVFLCPLWFLFIVVLLIFCIIFWIVSRAMRRKKENY